MTSSKTISAPDALVEHLETLAESKRVTLLREGDRLQVRGLLEPFETEYGDLPLSLEIRPFTDPPDETWIGRPVFVAYRLEEQDWSFRTVVREVLPKTVRVDPPTEARPEPPADPSVVRTAGSGEERAGHQRLSVQTETHEFAGDVIREVEGGDLFLRNTRRGHHINYPAKIREMLARLEMSGRAAVTVTGAHGIYASTVSADRLSAWDQAIRLTFVGRVPDPVESPVGSRVVMTLMHRGSLYSLPARLARWEEDDQAALVTIPKEAWRFQRRAMPRFFIDHMGFRVQIEGTALPEGTAIDISLGGLGAMFETSATLPRGIQVTVVLKRSGDHELAIGAVCVNTRLDDDGNMRAGFQFDGLAYKELRILTHLIQKCGRAG
jgi:hypothetical protein